MLSLLLLCSVLSVFGYISPQSAVPTTPLYSATSGLVVAFFTNQPTSTSTFLPWLGNDATTRSSLYLASVVVPSVDYVSDDLNNIISGEGRLAPMSELANVVVLNGTLKPPSTVTTFPATIKYSFQYVTSGSDLFVALDSNETETNWNYWIITDSTAVYNFSFHHIPYFHWS